MISLPLLLTPYPAVSYTSKNAESHATIGMLRIHAPLYKPYALSVSGGESLGPTPKKQSQSQNRE